jgi:hypothetical protein
VSDAEAQALAAAQSAADALASETAADTSAIASDASADASAASAAAALASKNAAATSETNAAGSATNAAAAKVGSETARDASVAARTASETARDASIQAKTDAQTAKTGAEAAQLASETARDASVTAKTGAEAAKAGAETARDEAVAAVDQINTGVLDQFVLKADNGSDFADPAQVLTTIGGQPLLTPVTQLEAEAGTLTVERSWTPKRVADAITYRIPSSYTIGAITGLQGALDLKAPLASPALSGTPTAPTAALATNTTQIATTAFVKIAIDDLKVGAPALYDTLAEIGTWLQNNDTELASSIATKAPLASPSFTGVVTTTGEFRTTSQNFLRAVQGNFGLLGRMDASDFYFLMTASGDQYGSYNGLRPFAINMTTGKVTIGNGLQSNTDILVGTGGTRLQPDGNLYMTWAGDWLSNVLNGKITTNGRAYPRNSSGGDINFFWSGQAGQPSWVWGGGDGTNMYVYNPSNFSVAYAANAGAISGVAVGSIVQFTVSSDPNEVNYPIGQILGVWNNASIRPRNEANTLRVYSGDTADWSLSSLGTGAVLAGTWRAKGVCSNDRQLFQRVA